MNDVFISYRRGDSAGHAGRLFDRLKAALGAEHVFMDVTDLRPGQDYATELTQAVARADCLLAVIGPRWLEAADAAGRRRIDDADDWVRQEVSAALAKGAVVIPVLVHGAQMPSADLLPEALRPLARRQAVTLTDQRWESDVRELVQWLSKAGTAAVPLPTSARRGHMAVTGWAALVLALVAGGAWLAWQASSLQPPQNHNAAALVLPPTPTPTPTAAGTRSAGHQQRFVIALPALSEVRLRSGRAELVVSILGIEQVLRDSDTQLLTVLVRMLNRGPSDEAFGSDQFRLVAGEQAIAPLDTLISAVDTMQAKEARLRFVVPRSAQAVALEVRVADERTRLPIALSARSPLRDDAALDDFGRPRPALVVDALKALPTSMPVGQQVEVGGAGYRLVAAVVERETVEKASLTLTVNCTAPRRSGGVSFGSSTVRLWIDGVPRAPTNFVNLAVDGGDSKEARFVFDLVELPQSLEVGLLNAGDSVKVPLSWAAVPRR